MSIVYRSTKGSKLTSNEVDGNFQYLENLIGGNGNVLVTQTGFTLVGQNLTIASGWVWKILNNTYTNASSVVVSIPFASTGKTRIDLVVANQSNTFVRVAGVESTSNPVAPSLPSNTILVTFYEVTDGVVLTPTEPIIGSAFKKKSEALGYGDPDLSGTNAVIQLRPEGNSRYAFSNASLISIDGFGLSLITGNPDAETPYDGKDLFIENTGTTPFTLLHDGPGTASSKFFFTDEQNLTIPAGEKVWLKYGSTTSELIFKSWQNESESGYKVIASNFNNSSIVTGTTSPTIIETYTIPANTFTAGDRIIFTCRIFKLVSTGQTQHSHFIGSGIEGAFGIFNSGTGYTYSQIKKDFTIKSSSITQGIGLNVNTNTSDVNQNVGGVNNINKNINWSIAQPLQIRIVNELSTDQSYVSFWELSRIRP